MKKLFQISIIEDDYNKKIRIVLFFIGIYIRAWTYDTYYKTLLLKK